MVLAGGLQPLVTPESASQAMSLGIAEIPPGTTLARHRHAAPEIYYLLSGTGNVEVDGIDYPVAAGVAVFIPGGAPHAFSNTGASTITFVSVPGIAFAEWGPGDHGFFLLGRPGTYQGGGEASPQMAAVGVGLIWLDLRWRYVLAVFFPLYGFIMVFLYHYGQHLALRDTELHRLRAMASA